MRTVTQYAYAWCGQRRGPWRSRRQDAELDALREGRGQRDRGGKRIFITVPADIMTRKVEPPMEEGRMQCPI
jgi:hypothetical protein